MSERWIWDRYWQCDRIASCFDGAGASNYDESIAAGWTGFLERLPPRARIIDLCTGNGAIALFAAGVSQCAAKEFAITAVDRADIDPPAYVSRNSAELAAINFVARTEVEALPFADGSFDVAISQYGLEYCDLSAAVPEVARVIAPGGKARFVVHAADGSVAAAAEAMLADIEMLVERIDLVGASRRCFQAVAKVETGDASPAAREQACKAVAYFKSALQQTSGYVARATDKVLVNNSGGVMLDAFQARQQVGFDAVFAKVDCVETEILAHRGRLQALLDAALDFAGASRLAEQLRAAGAEESAAAAVKGAQGVIGYEVTARF